MKKVKKSKPKYSPKNLLTLINDRFPNFLLGLTVVVLAVLVASLFFQSKDKSSLNIRQSITKLFGGKTDVPDQSAPKTYTVVKGDTLWSISEEAYGSGYNAYDLATLNKIDNADMLNEGMVISLPAMEPKDPTRGEIASGAYTTSAEQDSMKPTEAPPDQIYVVKAGESLWAISLKQYGNPYRWTEIRKSNPSIANPDLIYEGQSLKLL